MTDSDRTVVASLTQLIQEVTVRLVGITYYKVSGEINGELATDSLEIGELVPTYLLKMFVGDTEIGVRLKLSLKGEVGEIEVDLAANYVTPMPVTVPEAVTLEFANEVGIMALIPFIRETVFSISQRVFGSAVVLPVFQRGDISFTVTDASD